MTMVRITLEIQVPDRMGEVWTVTQARTFARGDREAQHEWRARVLAGYPGNAKLVAERRRLID